MKYGCGVRGGGGFEVKEPGLMLKVVMKCGWGWGVRSKDAAGSAAGLAVNTDVVLAVFLLSFLLLYIK